MPIDFCATPAACRACQIFPDAAARRFHAQRLGVALADFVCPTPEQRDKNRAALKLPDVDIETIKSRARSQQEAHKPAPCRFRGRDLGEAEPGRPCRGAPCECTHPANPSGQWWSGWCKASKCRLYEAKPKEA